MTFTAFAPWLFGFTTLLLAVVGLMLTSKYRAIVAIYKNGLSKVETVAQAVVDINLKLSGMDGKIDTAATATVEMRRELKEHLDTLHPRRKR